MATAIDAGGGASALNLRRGQIQAALERALGELDADERG
jgi:hypothetical protein